MIVCALTPEVGYTLLLIIIGKGQVKVGRMEDLGELVP